MREPLGWLVCIFTGFMQTVTCLLCARKMMHLLVCLTSLPVVCRWHRLTDWGWLLTCQWDCWFDNEQNALHCLEGMKQESGRQSLIDRLHRDRGRQLHELNQPRQMDKRVSFLSLFFFTSVISLCLPLLVEWHEGICPVKNWVVGCWHGYVSGSRCRFAYGPADATATHCLLLQLI